MGIKKILFKSLSATGVTYTSMGGIRFYDKNGIFYPSGALVTGGTSISSETENFKLTATSAYNAGYAVFHAFNTAIVQTTLVNPNQYWLASADNQTLTVEFKSVLNDISKIEFVLKPDSITDRTIDQPFLVEVLDENLALLQSYSVTPIVGEARNTIQTLNTPELLPAVNKTLILNGGQYKKNANGIWTNVSSALPTEAQFQSDGMDDLSVLNRSVKTVPELPVTQMTDDGVLGVGKVFSAPLDLSKYRDLRKVEIK